MYDSCVTLEESEPWCSLKTDLNNTHIDGDENIGICQDQCNIQNCPVGFFFLTGNCYHISARKKADLVTSTEEAESICLKYGSRLYQPRDYALTANFFEREAGYIKPIANFHFRYDDIEYSLIALGAYVDYIDGKGSMIMYNDETRAYFLESVIESQPDSVTSLSIPDITSYTGRACIMIDKKGMFTAELCEGFTDETKPVGYICEARIIHTIDGPSTGKACQLPFSLDGSLNYHSCVYNQTARYSWCPTKLNQNGDILPESIGYCPDEREIAYKGPGSGKLCNFPFLYDRIWHGTCTLEPRAELWCATDLSPSRVYEIDTSEFGYCTKYFAGSSDCGPNYSAVNGKCIRVSPFPETFDAASAKCNSEGAHLMPIHNDATMPPVVAHIAENKMTEVQYLPEYSPDLSAYWVGGIVEDFTWKWISSGKNFSVYSNWKGGLENEGCVQYSCTNNYGLTVQADSDFTWKATDRSIEKPYICESYCNEGFIWYKTVKKCVRANYLKKVTHSEALFECAIKNSRLLKFDTCEQFSGLVQDLSQTFSEEEQVYTFGSYHLGIDDYHGRRITLDTKIARGIIRSDGYSGILNCPELPDATSTSSEIGILSIDSTGAAAVTYSARDSEDTHGILCEQNIDWDCPSSYVLFHENCYKVFKDFKPFSIAKATCLEEKGRLVELEADFQYMFLWKLLSDEEVTNPIWTVFRKDPADLTDNPDLVFDAYDLLERSQVITGGNFF